MRFGTAVMAYVVMAVVLIMVCVFGKFLIVGKNRTPFTTGNGLYIIKGKAAQMANTAQGSSAIGTTNGLAGIFQED